MDIIGIAPAKAILLLRIPELSALKIDLGHGERSISTRQEVVVEDIILLLLGFGLEPLFLILCKNNVVMTTALGRWQRELRS